MKYDGNKKLNRCSLYFMLNKIFYFFNKKIKLIKYVFIFKPNAKQLMLNKSTKPSDKHEKKRLLGDLRDNLAGHDKPLAFLFGAGTSCAVKNSDNKKPLIPAIDGLTKQCKDDLNDNEIRKSWDAIENQYKGLNPNTSPNIENILSQIHIMIEALKISSSHDKLLELDIGRLKALDKELRKAIVKKVKTTEESIPSDLPHRKFARWLVSIERGSPVEIFTVNYDTLFEYALEIENVPFFDGFVGSYQPFFYPDSVKFDKKSNISDNWTKLWKIHGSVHWGQKKETRRTKIFRGGNDNSGKMIFPSMQKYTESRQQPYVTYLERLANFLEQDDAMLISIGFGFRDEHINNTIFDALENRPRTSVYALLYEDSESPVVERSREHKNITVVEDNKIIIGGKEKSLTLDNTENDGQESINITDFCCFCNFLEDILPKK